MKHVRKRKGLEARIGLRLDGVASLGKRKLGMLHKMTLDRRLVYHGQAESALAMR